MKSTGGFSGFRGLVSDRLNVVRFPLGTPVANSTRIVSVATDRLRPSCPEQKVSPVSEVLESFEIEWHGNTVVVVPAASVESLQWDLIEQAADVVMEPLKSEDVPMVVFDLARVGYFGSVFLALLLRCHKFLRKRGGELVLCGANEMARELLKITALDTIWAIYDTRQEAMQAIDS